MPDHSPSAGIPFRPLLRAVAMTCVVAAMANAQQAAQAAPPLPEQFRVPMHTAEPDGGSAYGIWAAGTGYKASFHDGATLVPMLGGDYPHNQPFGWHTRSVRIGEHELVTRTPALAWSEWRAEYDLGGVVEAYDVRTDGLEQTFVIDRLPAGSGELVIRGELTTALRAAPADAAHQALVFRDDAGTAIVRYGAATAVDATGARRAMRTSHADGEIMLHLDGEWLAAATLPVVIDPLLGPAAPVYGNLRGEVDLVTQYDLSGDVVWIAYSAAASASDHDLYVRRWSADGVLGSTPFTDLTTSWSTQRPRCAFDDYAGRAVITFDRSFASGVRAVRFHLHDDYDTSTNSSYHTIPATDNAWRADVGCQDFSSFNGTALVVWQQEPNGSGAFAETSSSDIFGCHVDVYSGTATAPFAIADGIGLDHERPRVAERTRSSSTKVVYQYFAVLGSNDDWDVAVRLVDGSGAVSAAYLVDNASPDHKMAPQIEGIEDDCLVAFTSSTVAQQPGKPTGSNGHQIRAVRLKINGSTMSEPFGTVVVQSNIDPRLELEGLAFDRGSWSNWGLLFRSTTTQNLYLRSLGYRGVTLRSETVFAPTGSDSTVGGGISSTLDGALHIAYANNATTGSSYVTFDRYEYPAAAPPSVTGASCSPGTLTWFGRQRIGTDTSGVYVTGTPPGMVHLLVVGLAPMQFVFQGIPPVLDGCSLLVPSIGPDCVGVVTMGPYAFFPNAVLLPLPEQLSDFTLYFQDFHTDATFTHLLSTARLEVPVVK